MINKRKEPVELLTQIIEKLDAFELAIERLEGELRTALEKESMNLESSDLQMLAQRRTRTLVELLRDEIEEFHHILRILLNEINNKE